MSIKDFFFSGPGRAFVIIALVVCAASFYVGRGMGYDTGRIVGYTSGQSAGYSEGYTAGKAESATVVSSAHSDIYKYTYSDLQKRYREGYDLGFEAGKQSVTPSSDWTADDEAQYWKGYSEGYDAGVEDGKASAGADSSPSRQPPADSGEIDPDTYKVWVSSGGNKYHTGDCGHIRNSVTKYEVTLREAFDMGKGACSDCPVPSPDDFIS